MNKIKAEIVGDSLSPQGERLTSLLITFPRIILAEINTHRMLSKNTSSSRAIPFNKMVEAIQSDPFIPIAFQRHHSGMQGTEYITDNLEVSLAQAAWIKAKNEAIDRAKFLYESIGVTKQIANRLLEPFMWTTMLITGSKEGWDNFFELRCNSYTLKEYNECEELINSKTFKSKKEIIEQKPNWYIRKDDQKRFGKFPKDMTDLEWLQLGNGQAEIHMMYLAEKIYDEYQNSVPLQLKENQWHIPFITVVED